MYKDDSYIAKNASYRVTRFDKELTNPYSKTSSDINTAVSCNSSPSLQTPKLRLVSYKASKILKAFHFPI